MPKSLNCKLEINKINFNKDRLLLAMAQMGYNVSVACAKVGLAPKTFYTYYAEDDDFRARVDELTSRRVPPEIILAVKEKKLDITEEKLMEKILEGDTTAIKYLLDNLGRSRGYNNPQPHIVYNIDTELDAAKELAQKLKKEF